MELKQLEEPWAASVADSKDTPRRWRSRFDALWSYSIPRTIGNPSKPSKEEIQKNGKVIYIYIGYRYAKWFEAIRQIGELDR